MCHRVFWINISLFLLLPLSIGFWLFFSARKSPVQNNYAPDKDRCGSVGSSCCNSKLETDNKFNLPDDEAADIIRHSESVTLSLGKLNAPLQQSDFTVDVEISGAIGYFNGKTNLQGQFFPDNPHRFLGQEEIRIDMYFAAEPREITININDFTRHLAGIPGRRYYWTSFILPRWPPTLDWRGNRLAGPYQLQVTAISRAEPELIAKSEIDDIEITGNVMSIVHVQAN